MEKLRKVVTQLESYLTQFELNNQLISNVSIGWHIDHACLVIIKITETVKQSNPDNFSSKFNFKKLVVFMTGKFPRGRAKAPASVMPIENIDQLHLMNSISNAKKAIIQLNECSKNQYFQHPIFGNLNKASTLYFLGIHTKHHLRIIQEIAN